MPLLLSNPPISNVPPLIRSASIVPAVIKSAKNPCPVPKVDQSQSLPSAVLLLAISNPIVPRHIAPNVSDSGFKSSNKTARTFCFCAMSDCARNCAFTPFMMPLTCAPITVPSGRIALSIRFDILDTSAMKLY